VLVVEQVVGVQTWNLDEKENQESLNEAAYIQDDEHTDLVGQEAAAWNLDEKENQESLNEAAYIQDDEHTDLVGEGRQEAAAWNLDEKENQESLNEAPTSRMMNIRISLGCPTIRHWCNSRRT
jgi:hypothetical protein